ncbi:hypothetical protein AN958_12086 [Leucoagaricus sp. SymC.cos]|nr:hypothetical protein AN958_12086 [Leucoagaricus sp. SymC.cos]
MIYDPATAPHLKPWLVRTLEPICDAEPGALADYVLALLKHNASEPEMRKELLSQLDEFLEKECPPFVDTLFTVLRTKSYLPYAAEPEPSTKTVDNGIPIPLDLITPPPADTGSDRSRKRSIEADDRDDRPSAKGPRLNSQGHFSRYGGQSSGQWEGRGDEGRGRGYANGGMDGYNMHMMGGMGHMNGDRRSQSYQPPGQKRGICRDYHNNGYCARGAMCKYSHGEDAMVPGQLYPMHPGMPFMSMFPGGMPFVPGGGYDPNDSRIDMRPRHQRAPMLPRNQQEEGGVVHASGELPVIQDLTPAIPKDSTDATAAEGQPQTQHVPAVGDEQSQPSQQKDAAYDPQAPERRVGDKTLVVEKIPEDKLSLENVNDWFKRFGAVTNVAIDPKGGKALVSFSSHDEAHAAWKSEDAVFNNRFVKPSSAPTNTAASALAAKQLLLEQQIAEQKSLMASLETATPEEKKNIMARLRKLGEEMKSTSTPTPPSTSQGLSSTVDDKEKMEKDKLDKELDLHGAGVPSEPSTAPSTDKQETTEDLKAKLEKLKAEAASLGLSTEAPSGDWNAGAPSYRGSYRGRARGGRGYLRGAPRGGGAARFNMSLDNRPKKLLVKGAKSEQMQAVKDWYETTGQLDTVEPQKNGDLIVSFKTRAAAEQGLAKGNNVSTVGSVQLSWYSAKPSNAPAASAAASKTVAAATTSLGGKAHEEGRQHTPEPEAEEEMVARGWGGEDDGDGMGML